AEHARRRAVLARNGERRGRGGKTGNLGKIEVELKRLDRRLIGAADGDRCIRSGRRNEVALTIELDDALADGYVFYSATRIVLTAIGIPAVLRVAAGDFVEHRGNAD